MSGKPDAATPRRGPTAEEKDQLARRLSRWLAYHLVKQPGQEKRRSRRVETAPGRLLTFE